MDDGGKEWCIQRKRCTGDALDSQMINGIMLRFRPIAPKPADGELVPGAFLPENNSPIISEKRMKRKYVRVSKNTRSKRNNKPSDDDVDKTTVTTLQLLPEKPDGNHSPAERSWSDHHEYYRNRINVRDSTTWLNFVMNDDDKTGGFGVIGLDRTVTVPRVRVVESWVTVVESWVTDTCMERRGLGSTDVERRLNLEVDACPGFISNGYNAVEWVNEAYKRMITRQKGEGQTTGEHEQHEEVQVLVWLVIKEKLPYILYPAFTCHVRLQYACGKENSCSSLTLPCDTWRMDCGGFAWKLDVKAALSLGPMTQQI